MKIRLITGSCYIAVLVAFFLLKIFVNDLFFDALIYAFAIIGTFEMIRAMKEYVTTSQKIFIMIFTILCYPAVALCEYFNGNGMKALSFGIIIISIFLLSMFVIQHEETSPQNIGVSFLCAIYPTLLLSLLCLINHFSSPAGYEDLAFNSNLGVLFVFVISPFSDSLAYVFGRFMKGKFPKKMAPEISPNKTVVGGIGGLVGGVVGAAILYFAYNAIAGTYSDMQIWLPVYLIIGLVTALATEFGDLVESCIKRKVEIKDMGKLLPGHGGILDRIDGTLFASIIVYIAFTVVYAIL